MKSREHGQHCFLRPVDDDSRARLSRRCSQFRGYQDHSCIAAGEARRIFRDRQETELVLLRPVEWRNAVNDGAGVTLYTTANEGGDVVRGERRRLCGPRNCGTAFAHTCYGLGRVAPAGTATGAPAGLAGCAWLVAVAGGIDLRRLITRSVMSRF
jgi:hypothetical protein